MPSVHVADKLGNPLLQADDCRPPSHNQADPMVSGARSVVIVGMNRSGTSSVAGALSNFGVYFGETTKLYAPDEFNPRGYWEHRLLNESHRRFHLSLNLQTVDIDPLPEDWRDRPLSEGAIDHEVQLYRREFGGKPLWGWKDPQASSLLPFVPECFQRCGIEPVIAICARNPIDVADSQFRRHGTPRAQTIGSWLMNTLAALRSSRGLRRSVVLYENLLKDPRHSIARVVEQLEAPESVSSWESAIHWIEPGIANSAGRFSPISGWPELVSDTYELCRLTSENPDKLQDGGFDEVTDAYWQRWTCLRSMFSRPPVGEATLGLGWRHDDSFRHIDKNYVPSRSWQTVCSTTDAGPGSRVSVYLYPLPALVWVRHAVWHYPGGSEDATLLPGRHGLLRRHSDVAQVWLAFGAEQIAATTPTRPGPYELELEFLIESTPVTAGLVFQELSRRLDEQGLR